LNSTATDFDTIRFAEWLYEQTGETAPVTVTPLRGGGSCEMFRVERLGQAWVVRRAPVTAVASTAHQVIREAQIMETLATQGIPVPTVLAGTEDPSILGAPFFVMSFVEGEVIGRGGMPDVLGRDPDSHGHIGEQLIDILVQLHTVDWGQTALTELSRPQGFLPRQVDRWMNQLDGYRTRELDGVDDVATWLSDNLPTSGDLTVMHGDYKLDNVIWAPSPPPRIACVVDFEMTTIGDPLVDLAWAMMFWPSPGNAISISSGGGDKGINPDRCQSPEALVDRYVAATGRDMTWFDWYQAFSAWKLAIVMEGSYAKYVRGASGNPLHEYFGAVVEQLLTRAKRFAR
jgi:aminoglycoside phosphotransferase (APT) family kinase protein